MTGFTYVELFAGIGGVSFGFDKNGGTCVMASEIDKYASQAFKALHPGVDLRGDVTKIDANDVPDHDVLSFTSPCQSFSTAGKRKGFEDTRGTLTFEALRIAKVKRPKALFMENVKGLVNHDKGNTLDTIIHAMNEIGYTVDFNVLNSKHYGVPQNRERVFIVALRDDLVSAERWVNAEGSTMLPKARRRMTEQGVRTFNFDWNTQTEVTTHLRDILETEVDGSYYLSEEKTSALVAQHENGLAVKEATKQGYAIATEGDAVNFQFPDSKTRRGRVGKQIANTLEASNINQGVVEEIRSCSTRTRAYAGKPEALEIRKDFVSNTITSVTKDAYVIKSPEYCIRKLTPLECFRLQSFSDEHYQTLVNAGLSNSRLYKFAGNAVTVNVIHAIGERLLPYLT